MGNAAQAHMGRVAALGCCVCDGIMQSPGTPAEVHHIGDSADRSDWLVIPLCHVHHRTGGLRVAYHAGPKEWEALYGSEMKWLAWTIKKLSS